jgi:hypothetical protein
VATRVSSLVEPASKPPRVTPARRVISITTMITPSRGGWPFMRVVASPKVPGRAGPFVESPATGKMSETEPARMRGGSSSFALKIAAFRIAASVCTRRGGAASMVVAASDRPVLRGHELLPERAVRRGADGQVPGAFRDQGCRSAGGKTGSRRGRAGLVRRVGSHSWVWTSSLRPGRR